ncbi:MAG: preprotein translocase subunit SecY, partial [Candidatus Hodarchaeota archaeon]
GWGLGSGISLFIAGGVATQITWGAINLQEAGDGLPMGAVAATGSALVEDFPMGIEKVFFERKDVNGDTLGLHQAVTTFAFLATLVVFMIVIYFESMRIELPLTYAKYRGFRGKYPIKLLYVSNIPVILVSAVFADLYFIVQMITNTWNKDQNNFFFNALGQYDSNNQPSGGLIYFLTPPRGIPEVLKAPERAFVYAIVMIGLSIVFALMWIETAGMGPRDVSRQLIQAGMAIPGWRRSQKIIEKRLAMYIPTAGFIGGLFIGVLAAGADFLGALGTGTGILLSVSICRQYFDILVKEKAADMHPALRDFLGIM